MNPDITQCPRVLLFIPAYNCAPQLRRVLRRVAESARSFHEVLVVDNGSPDHTLAAAQDSAASLGTKLTIVRNLQNLNLGGSHKVAFKYAMKNNFDLLVILHGDDQADVRDVLPLLASIKKDSAIDCWLGSRFMSGSQRTGYSSIRTLGNIVFNALFSAVTLRWISDLGSGLNVYSVKALAKTDWMGFRNNLTFNYFLTLAYAEWRWNCVFFPITWRETDQVSNVRALRQIREMLAMLTKYVFDRNWIFKKDHNGLNLESYEANVVYSHSPKELN